MDNQKTVRYTNEEGQDRKLRCAIIGCGEISFCCLPVYRDLPWVEVTHCVDTIRTRAEEAAQFVSEKQAQPAEAISDYKIVIESDADVVVINTPNHLHVEHAIAALNAGKHVLLQKPVAPSYEDSLMLLQVANGQRKKGILAGMYMSYLEQPAIQEIISMARAGIFGEITQLHGRLMHADGLRWSKESIAQSNSDQTLWRRSIQQTGGGAFIQLAVHCIRLFRSISNECIVAVKGYAGNLHCPGLEGEDTASAIFHLESGACATVDLSWCSPGEELSVHGTEGSAVFLNNSCMTLLSHKDWFGDHVQYLRGSSRTFAFNAVDMGDAESPFNQHRRFMRAVIDGREPDVPLSSGVEDMAVVAAFYESVQTGQTAGVPLVPGNVIAV